MQSCSIVKDEKAIYIDLKNKVKEKETRNNIESF